MRTSLPGVRLRAHAWRVLYRSTAATGEPTAVSGTRAGAAGAAPAGRGR